MEDNKKSRGLGKGLSELLGEARAKAAISKQQKTEVPHLGKENNFIETSNDYSIKDNDFSKELDNLNNIADVVSDFEEKVPITTHNETFHEAIKQENNPPVFDDINNKSHNNSYNSNSDDELFETITTETLPDEENKPYADAKTVQLSKFLDKTEELLNQEIFSEDIEDGIKPLVSEKNVQKNQPVTNQPLVSKAVTHNQKDIIHHLPIEFVNPNKEQPRKFFDVNDLNDLASSIKIYGVIQPILVKQTNGEYLIVAGERRWRASQIAGLKVIPAIIVDYHDDEILEVALIENIQRANLTPIDEAKAYYYLIHKYELTQNELAQKVGKSRSYVANMVRLLELDDNVKNYLETGELSIGHARVLVGVKNAADLAEKIIKSHMSVRKVEELISQLSEKQNVRLPKAFNTGKNTDILALEADLKAALGVNVSINTQSAQKGNLVIRYESLDQLDEVCRRLCSNWGTDVA